MMATYHKKYALKIRKLFSVSYHELFRKLIPSYFDNKEKILLLQTGLETRFISTPKNHFVNAAIIT